MPDVTLEFSNAMEANGITPPVQIEADGNIHRFNIGPKKGKRNGWYVLYCDGIPNGVYGDWSDGGGSYKWCSKSVDELSPAEREKQRQQFAAAKRKREREKLRLEKIAAKECAELWNKAGMVKCEHSYLKAKKVRAYGIKQLQNMLLIPVMVAGVMTSLQFIMQSGDKQFKTGGRKKDGYHSIGKPQDKVIIICEGYATGASIHYATGKAVAIAFDAGNLKPVAIGLRKKYADYKIVIAADNDQWTENNPGLSKAKEAADLVNGVVAFPVFSGEIIKTSGDKRPTDFNDLHTLCGVEAVREQLNSVAQPGKQRFSEAGALEVSVENAWPLPGEIAHGPDEKPFPISAFPDVAQKAILEFQAYGKQPLAMIASAALGQMSLVAQGLVDVSRDPILKSPCSLNVLIIGESGERKTAVDSAFSSGSKAWQLEQIEKLLPEHRKGQAMRQAVAERKLSVIKKIAATEGKKGQDNEDTRRELELRLEELCDQELSLHVPPIPHLHYEDVTTEGLSHSLATGWPSSMLASDEAGIVVGGRGMADEAALGFLTLLNRLWDGRGIATTRKQAKAAEMVGRRFSCSLMLQGELLSRIVEKGGRGVGFFGRYLIATPKSTMGSRKYTPPQKSLAFLRDFNDRAYELLSIDLPTNDRFELEPPVMTLDDASHQLWVSYHDSIERQLGVYGDYALVRDVGAKSAENAARIACVLQVWGKGVGGDILPEYMSAGITLASWYLNEASRLFFNADKPQEIKDAESLSTWLTTDGSVRLDTNGCLPVADVLRLGPYQLRTSERRDNAIKILVGPDVCHVKHISEGRKKGLMVNPKLLNSNE